MFTQQNLLGRGWTKVMIEKYLGNPDKTIPNQHYRKALERKGMLYKGWEEKNRIKLYSEERVLITEQRPLIALKIQVRKAKKNGLKEEAGLIKQIELAYEQLLKLQKEKN